ncbi:MAG: hypothetical protein ACR2HD_07480 [Solirubrobacteraceae bacterium]|nr:MAG: hypothetical protein DLM63_13280 [Solirubrobacterales bacterium]
MAVALVVIILLIIGIKSCVDSANRNALRSYAESVTTISQDSQSQVSQPFFGVLTSGAQPIELASKADDVRASADVLVKRAEALSPPGSLAEAQRDLVLTLVLRRDAIARIASKLTSALSDQGSSTSVNQISGQMEVFLASDVIFSQRVVPLISQALSNGGLSSVPAPDPNARFLNDLGWLQPNTVATRLSAPVGATPGVPPGGIAPGTHGHALTSTAIAGVTLQSGQANRIPLAPGLAFTVTFRNDGTNNERNVGVTVTITGAGGAPVTLHSVVPQTVVGQSATASLPLANPPPSGTPVTIKTSIQPVPGEKTFTHNSATYQAIFQK